MHLYTHNWFQHGTKYRTNQMNGNERDNDFVSIYTICIQTNEIFKRWLEVNERRKQRKKQRVHRNLLCVLLYIMRATDDVDVLVAR